MKRQIDLRKMLFKGLLYSFLFIFIFGILFISFAVGENTQQYNKIYLDPFYRASMVSNTNYTYNININPPDKIGVVNNAMINFQVYITPSVVYTLWVNDKSCKSPTFTILTTYASAGLGLISFDCSNIINKEGNYKLTLRADKNSGSSFGWLDLTYSNNLKQDFELHGTEYTIGQQAKVWLQLRNITGDAIEYGICYVDIYTPDNNIFLERATMNNLNHDGIYFYDIDTTGMAEGVYPAIARCYYIATQTPNFATAFSVITGSYDSGALSDTYTENGVYLLTTESPLSGGNPRRYLSEFDFNSQVCLMDPLLLNGITIKWVGRWNSIASDPMTIQIYNHTSASWLNLSNTIPGSGTGVKTTTNSIISNNLTQMGLANSTGGKVRLRFTDTPNADTSSTGFDYDLLSVYCDAYSIPVWQSVSGSSEMHLSPVFNVSGLNISGICETNITYILNTTYIFISNTTIFNTTCDLNTTSLNESVNFITGSIINIEEGNTMLWIVVFIIAFLLFGWMTKMYLLWALSGLGFILMGIQFFMDTTNAYSVPLSIAFLFFGIITILLGAIFQFFMNNDPNDGDYLKYK